MSTPEYEHWQNLTVRRPGDVRTLQGGPVPLSWQCEKRTAHNDRLTNSRLPADFPHQVERGDAGDALACLALEESIRRDIEAVRASRVREALELGSTWRQIADALDITADDARAVLRQWADAQHHVLYRRDVEDGQPQPLGLDDQGYAAVLAVCELGDDETAPGPAGAR
ncbi:hypothetical protein [Streptomyces demainii]|uniref:Sigma-70 family RNA polymerase sigma factor n=1 Tax=Streptomyces demainii TaxID=588122 RepID=A0ABT9L6U5_9ACTN|nr:hypothetical protein [Streptomyces demainii]MDP9616436.1 hypothetical protein [Streptomyces demainii]